MVADRVAAPVERAGTGASGFLYGYWTGVPVEGYEWYWRPGVLAGMAPTNDGRTCVIAGGPAARVRGLGPAGFERLLAEADPAVLHRVRAGSRDGRVLRLRRPARIPAPGVRRGLGTRRRRRLLEGPDRNARNHRRLARRRVAGPRLVAAAPGPGVRRNLALASYQADRDRLSAPLLDVIDDIASFEWDQPRLRRLLVELAAAMTDEVEAIVAFDHGNTSTLAA